MFDNKFNIKNTLEAEKAKAEEEKNKTENEKKEEIKKDETIKILKNKEIKNKNKNKSAKNNSKNGIKNLVDLYLKNQGIKYSDWLAEKHQELVNEMIEKNILTIKGEEK